MFVKVLVLFKNHKVRFGNHRRQRICGRIGTVPPFQWYVDEQKPVDVTVFMQSIGLNDSRSEGLSFSLQSEHDYGSESATE